jgi:hypothetical protein
MPGSDPRTWSPYPLNPNVMPGSDPRTWSPYPLNPNVMPGSDPRTWSPYPLAYNDPRTWPTYPLNRIATQWPGYTSYYYSTPDASVPGWLWNSSLAPYAQPVYQPYGVGAYNLFN